jgi:hypothetical protein
VGGVKAYRLNQRYPADILRKRASASVLVRLVVGWIWIDPHDV